MTGLASGRAVLVGIETYDFGVGGDLDGPASDAVRMAEFLVRAGLPADRVDLLIAPAEGGEDRFAAAVVPPRIVNLDNGRIRGRDTRGGDVLYRFFNDELRRHRADVLVVYWAGHGFEYDNRQWLCYPGASATNMQGLDFDGELLPTMAGAEYPFAEQYYFVDACRTAYDRLQLPAGPIGRKFAPAGGDGGHRQHSLLASVSGATTANLPARSTGAFSQALREALAAEPAWPWRTDEILRRIAGATGLPPVTVTSTGPGGHRTRVALGSEASPAVGPALTPGPPDPVEIADLLARVPRMTDPDRIRRVAVELEMLQPGLRLGTAESPEDLVWALHRASAGLRPLLELIRVRADYFPDFPQTRSLRLTLEAHCA
ncbi:caspase family protein [Actinoplanes sp. NPDC051346]|uniref:caspase family protein n=1 Tax=Actinoplanes sp. NPDC051346 TaxID=3155048 RepID=UPI00343C4B48